MGTVFNAASVSALLSAVVSLIGGVGAWVLGRAPDWEDVRPLARVGVTAAVAAACNFPATLEVAPAVYTWTGRVQVLALALHVAAWYHYILQWSPPLSPRVRIALFGPLYGAGAIALVPGVMFGDAVALRHAPWLGLAYHDPVVRSPGFAIFAILLVLGAGGVARLATLRGRGVPFRRGFVAVTCVILAAGLHDAVVIGGLSAPTPYLLDFGLLAPAWIIGLLTLRRVVITSTDLRRLRTGLEVAVVERTAALERSQAALASAERLAALGQFASGFAREVESPVKAVEANLEALARELREDPRTRVRDRLGDARAALGRIAALARQLLVAGRAAAPQGPAVDVRVMPAAEAAIGAARDHGCPEGVAFEIAVSPGLTVEAHEQELQQVLVTLVLRAVSRVPSRRPGKVTIRGQSAGERVRISVEDDGPELSQEELEHAFEPFHEAEGVAGMGLALAFARGLVEGMGGTLSLERETGRGTRAIGVLARGAPAASPADLPAAPVAAPRRARILVADRDARMLLGLVQELSAEHEVEAVSGVREALAALADRTFDLVLCDAALPGGGGERFWQELLLRAPALQARVAFLVSGSEEAPSVHDFLARQPQPVLGRPLGLAEVQVAFDWLGIPGGSPDRLAVGDGPDRVIGRMRGRSS